MSLAIDGVWKAGVWATTVWADGVWREGAYVPTVTTGANGSKRKIRYITSAEKIRREALKTHEAAREIERLKIISAEPEFRKEAEKISRELQESILILEREIEAIQTRLAEKALFAEFSAKVQADKLKRDLQLLMAQAQVYIEYAKQQSEELDIVFITFMLVSMK